MNVESRDDLHALLKARAPYGVAHADLDELGRVIARAVLREGTVSEVNKTYYARFEGTRAPSPLGQYWERTSQS